MLIMSLNDLLNYRIETENGKIGCVRDYYFDDLEWTIRYLVVDTSTWLENGREVLLSPASALPPDQKRKSISMKLTREQVENSPNVDTHKPVSREMEGLMARHYSWPAYWLQPMAPVLTPPEPRPSGPAADSDLHLIEPHLRSLREVTGYHIEAEDGSIGHVEEFLVHPAFWKIRYMVVDTKNWLPGDKVIVALRWIHTIDWASGKVRVDLTKRSIENAPRYEPPVTPAYEMELYNYYGRPYK